MPLPTPYRRIEFRAHELARVEHPLVDCIAAALALVHDTTRPLEGVVFTYDGVDVFLDRTSGSVDQLVAEYTCRLQERGR